MHWLWVFVIGLVVGVVAKLLTPGKDPGGFIITALIGIAGSLLATWVGQNLFGWYQDGQSAGFIASVVGAIVLLLIYHLVKRKSASPSSRRAAARRDGAGSAEQLAGEAFEHAEVESATLPLPLRRHLAIGRQVVDRMRQHLRQAAQHGAGVDPPGLSPPSPFRRPPPPRPIDPEPPPQNQETGA
ncbi:hypothetical protein RLIN73S_04138 [Rhodanobacter lindaniclasticus]